MVYEIMDLYSGGYSKTEYGYIYVYADSEDDAIALFENKFPCVDFYGAFCSCCGSDFTIRPYLGDIAKGSFIIGGVV